NDREKASEAGRKGGQQSGGGHTSDTSRKGGRS
ncbi:KGG domain-containing protein, partial [Pseudomonas sp. UBA800]